MKKYYTNKFVFLLCALTILIFASTTGNSSEQSICNSVITKEAFNTTDYNQSSLLVLDVFTDFCNKEYESLQHIKNSSKNTSLGSTLSIIDILDGSLDLSDAKKLSNNYYSIKDTSFCKTSKIDIFSKTNLAYQNKVTDYALNVWNKCIQTIESNKIFVEYTLNANSTGITGKLKRYMHGTTGAGIIKGISASGNNFKSLKCHISGKKVTPNKKVSINIDRTDIVFDCIKNKNNSIKIALVTTQGDQDWIALPSHSEQEKFDIVTDLKIKLDSASTSINSLKNEVSTLRLENNNLKQQSALCCHPPFVADESRIRLQSGDGHNFTFKSTIVSDSVIKVTVSADGVGDDSCLIDTSRSTSCDTRINFSNGIYNFNGRIEIEPNKGIKYTGDLRLHNISHAIFNDFTVLGLH